MLRKLSLLVALVVLALCVVQAAVAGPKNHGGNSPNGNAWGQTTWADGN
ncbi:MAG TPA: hypothetical protein VF101_03115 [Gaiellaceae bacterium]